MSAWSTTFMRFRNSIASMACLAIMENTRSRRDGKLGCPANFNLLTVGWYVNEPAEGDEPNLQASADFSLVASRDIIAGEELTARYKTFSDPDAPNWALSSAAFGRPR